MAQENTFNFLKQLALELPCYISQGKRTFVKIQTNGMSKIIPIMGEEFRNYLLYQLFQQGKSLGTDKLNNIVALVSAKATYEGIKISTAVRLGSYKNIFYYDLENGKYCKVRSNSFEVIEKSPLVFTESQSSLPQPMPEYSKNIDIWSLSDYFNVKDDSDFILLLVYVISCFVPDIPHQILILQGSQGSAKTTAAKMIKRLVDPSQVDVSTLPKNKEDLVLQLSNEYVAVFDNIFSIKPDIADLFCQVCTGGHFLKRKLYTDNETVVYSFKRCLILTGVYSITTQPDLLDRSIVLTLKKISGRNRRTEKEIFQSFLNDIPYILYSIFEILSMAKSLHRTLKIEHLPRMADAVQWQCCIAEFIGIDYRDFLKIYADNQNKINQEIVTAHPVVNALLQFMENKQRWQGAISDLWNQLNLLMGGTNDVLWAKSPSSLSRQLNILKLSLERIGVYFNTKNIGKYKLIVIRKK